MKISFSAHELPDEGVLVVGVLENSVLTPSAEKLNETMLGGLVRAMEAGRFQGKKDQSLALIAPAHTSLDRALVVGLGAPADATALRLQAVGGQIFAALATQGHKRATVAIDPISESGLDPAQQVAEIAFGARLRSYRFDKYLTKEKEEDKPSLRDLTFTCADVSRAKKAFATLDKVALGVMVTRDLVSEPANVLYPEALAKEAEKLSELGVSVEVLDEDQMRKLGMNALLGVGQGSEHDSRLVVMEWNGTGDGGKSKKDKKARKDAHADGGPIAILGKGVTFDTGGISIKPAAGMEDMKWDMAGAATVIGLMRVLAAREAKVHAVGLVGLVENMPSGRAQRPGDIVRSMSGQTIEILNTDAEGRLVLADVLWYCKERFKPRFMIDLATLTGAIIISLGNEKAGLFANDDDLAAKIIQASEAVGEPVWRMPLGDEYDKMLKSDAADMKNIGNKGAGSITAAQFLQRFVGDVPWAHLDIAGVAWSKKDRDTVPKGATAFGVRLLDRLVADHFEGD